MKIELHINDKTWGLTVNGVTVDVGLLEPSDFKPKRYAVHVASRMRVWMSGDKIPNPTWERDKRQPRYVKDQTGWVIAEENPAEVGVRLASLITRNALTNVQSLASASVQERRLNLIAGGGGLA